MSLDAVHSMLAWFQQKGGYINPSAEVRDGESPAASLPSPTSSRRPLTHAKTHQVESDYTLPRQ